VYFFEAIVNQPLLAVAISRAASERRMITRALTAAACAVGLMVAAGYVIAGLSAGLLELFSAVVAAMGVAQ
jgi:hypothetical protein